jgi:putative peptidoglycan lipid II flippase
MTSPASPSPADEAASPHEMERDTGENLAGATTILAIGNITSRVLGFAKEIIIANTFGVGRAVDAFQIAITIPRDLYDLAIFGHTNSALVPVLSEYAARKDKTELWALLNILISLIAIFAGGLMLVMFLFTPQIVTFYRGQPSPSILEAPFNFPTGALNNPGLSQAAFDQTAQLLQLTAPALLFMSLYSILSGALYALKRFSYPAFGAALFNLLIMVCTVLLAPSIGIQGVAIGWVAAAVGQLILQLIGLRGAKLRLDFLKLGKALRHPGLKAIAALYVPVLGVLLFDVLINRPFSYNIASQTGEGNVATMNWATSLREFPMGLVGTAISIAILPTLARQALNKDQAGDFRDTLGRGIRLALALIIPASVGMFVLAGPLIGLVFERGAFTEANTTFMAAVLRFYLLGIPFAAIDLLLIFAFYAQRDSLTPALIGLFSLACYVTITLLLLSRMGFFSLMIADSAKHLIHMGLSLWLLHRKLGGLGHQQFFRTVLKVVMATALMGVVTWLVARGLADVMNIQGTRERFILVAVPSLIGGLLYLAVASAMRVQEITLFFQAIGRKFRRGKTKLAG